MGNFTLSFKIPELPARYLDLPSEVWIYRPRSANGELSRKIPARTARLFEVIMTECVFSNSVSMRLVLRATLALLCCRLADRVKYPSHLRRTASRDSLLVQLQRVVR
jgi:hypothetical protein